MCRSKGVTGFYFQILQELGDYLFISLEFEPTEYSKDKSPNKCCKHPLHNSVIKEIAHISSYIEHQFKLLANPERSSRFVKPVLKLWLCGFVLINPTFY